MPEHQQTQRSAKSKTTSQKQATPQIQTPISHPIAIIQRARINPKSLTHADVMQLQRTIGNRAVGRLLSEIGLIPSTAKQAPTIQRQEMFQRQEIPEEEEPLQGKFEGKPEITCPSCFTASIVQRQEIPEEEPLQGKMIDTVQWQEIPEEEELLQTKRENNTGMPDNLKAGVENLSGIDMSDVKVHYNSSKPAEVGALAYTQGTNIHVAPEQEKHLPHEAWHVVQQMQGRVQATMQIKELGINDDPSLEHEADMMGTKTTQLILATDEETLQGSDIHVGSGQERHVVHDAWHVVQQKVDRSGSIQRKLDLECDVTLFNEDGAIISRGFGGNGKRSRLEVLDDIQSNANTRTIADKQVSINEARAGVCAEPQALANAIRNIPKSYAKIDTEIHHLKVSGARILAIDSDDDKKQAEKYGYKDGDSTLNRCEVCQSWLGPGRDASMMKVSPDDAVRESFTAKEDRLKREREQLRIENLRRKQRERNIVNGDWDGEQYSPY